MRSFSSKKYSIIFLLLFLLVPAGKLTCMAADTDISDNPQEEEEYIYSFVTNRKINSKLGGYVKAEYFYDSRQVLGFSTDQVLVFPRKQDLDPAGNDKNARGEGHAVAIESRLGFEFEGTKVQCADLSGILEADFWLIPAIESDPIAADLFRLRHAAIFLKWPDIQLTMGQYWHPVFIQECYPHTVSFNTGLPFDPAARAPQVRCDYEYDGFHLIGCASFQLDFSNIGPNIIQATLDFKDAGSPRFMGRSLVPNLDLSFKKFFGNHSVGAGIDYNRFVPRLVSDEGFAVIEPLSAVTAFAWIALNWENKFEVHSKIAYCQNATGYKVLGGFGTHKIECEITGRREYANIDSLNIWWDLIALPDCNVEPGIFIAFAKNLGTLKSILPEDLVFGIGVREGTGNAIDHLIRVSPRCRWKLSESITLAAELELTRAAYGTIQDNGKVAGIITPVNNIRGLLATYYWF